MFLIEKSGRERPICRECCAFHKPANCPKEKARRRREKAKSRRWFMDAIAMRDAITAERARQA